MYWFVQYLVIMSAVYLADSAFALVRKAMLSNAQGWEFRASLQRMIAALIVITSVAIIDIGMIDHKIVILGGVFVTGYLVAWTIATWRYRRKLRSSQGSGS